MKFLLLFLLLSGMLCFGQAQQSACNCPKNPFTETMADTAFHLSNGKTIALCGFRNPDSRPVNFSEFVLAVCGQDTVLDFWPAALTCQLQVVGDTLLIEHLKMIPTGPRFAFRETIWMREHLYFVWETTFRKSTVNRSFRRYRPDEIQAVLKAYEKVGSGQSDAALVLANRLFMAILSGSLKARQIFGAFEGRFGPLTGHHAEEYHELTEMLRQWDGRP